MVYIIKTILVVDDSATARMILAQCVQMTFSKETVIEQAQNGREALNILRSKPIDLIVSDIQMPEMTGLELLQTIRQAASFNTVPFFLVSSLAEENSEKEWLKQGAQGVIKKPVTPIKFRAAISKLGKIENLRGA